MYFPVLLWSLVIFASFWGYGEALRRALKRPEFDDLGWGLTITWGVCVVVAVGGLLLLFHAAKPAVLVMMILLGFLFGALAVSESLTRQQPKRRKGEKPAKSMGIGPIEIVLFVIALITFLSAVAWPFQIDPNDDWIAYLMYPEKILQTGTFLDPFSLRRVSALGGQSFLQAIIMVVGAPENGHLLDRGMGAVILLGMMLGIVRSKGHRVTWVTGAIISAALLSAVPRIHTGSHLLGLTLLFALLCTVVRLLDTPKPGWMGLLPVGLVLAAASTLRPLFAIVGAGTLIFFFAWRILHPQLGTRIQAAVSLVQSGLLTLAFLLPWMILSYLSSGTPMFPLSNGFAVPEMIFGGTKEGGWADVTGALRLLSLPEIALMLAALAVTFWLPPRLRRLGISAALASIGMVALSTWKMSAASPYDVYRYLFPVIGFSLWWCLLNIGSDPERRVFRIPSLAVAIAGLFMFGLSNWKFAVGDVASRITSLPLQLQGFQYPVAGFVEDYNKLQQLVPKGEKIFTAVDAPYLLDFSRNPIDNIDSIGGASPPPGMPFGEGPEALKKYLNSLGFHYAMVVDFDSAVLLYTRRLWENHPRPEWYFKEVWGKYALDFMDNMDRIADWNTIATSGNVRLIKLH
jgi:hypothetical protein